MMITCPFCQAANVPNTVFCCGCGFLLLDQDTIDTKLMDTDAKPKLAPQAAGRSGFTSSLQPESDR
jgi:hypothetical protein